MSSPVKVNICKKDYYITHENSDYIRRVATAAEDLIYDIQQKTAKSTFDASILACVSLMDDFVTAKNNNEKLMSEIKKYATEKSMAVRELDDVSAKLTALTVKYEELLRSKSQTA